MRTLQMQSPQIRAGDDGTLTLEGIAAPYGETIEYGGQRESFAPGAFDVAEAVGRPLLWSHDRAEPVGHITAARDTAEGLSITAIVQPTQRGKDAIMLLRSKSLRGLSVGFEPVEWSTADDGSISYTRTRLHELSLTPLNAYASAEVSATRSLPSPQEGGNMPETTAVLDGIHARMDSIEARMTTPEPPQARTLGVREALALQLADAARQGPHQLRALADVLSSGNAGVLPPQWASEVRTYVDGNRYLFPQVGHVPFPSAGYSLTVPKVLQSTLVGPRGAEKTEIPSRAYTTGSDTYTATWYAGGVDVALELIWQSDPAIQALIVEDLLAQYAAVTDQALTLALETAATPTGTVLDLTSYGAFVGAVFAASEQIRAATGQPGDRLGLTSASWGKVIGFTDAGGQRILASGGASNSDGSASLVATSVDIGGIQVFHNPRAAEDLQFNVRSARVAEKPPTTLTQDVVALMGRDLGVLGAVIPLPYFPAGIKVHSLAVARERTSAGGKK